MPRIDEWLGCVRPSLMQLFHFQAPLSSGGGRADGVGRGGVGRVVDSLKNTQIQMR